MITENLSTLKIHKLTQAQYDRELAAGRIDDNTLYLTPDEEVDLSGYALKDDVSSTYETKEDSASKLIEAKTYVDAQIAAIPTPDFSDYASQEYVDIRVPAWTSADEGKFLRIVNGTPAWSTVDSAEGVEF